MNIIDRPKFDFILLGLLMVGMLLTLPAAQFGVSCVQTPALDTCPTYSHSFANFLYSLGMGLMLGSVLAEVTRAFRRKRDSLNKVGIPKKVLCDIRGCERESTHTVNIPMPGNRSFHYCDEHFGNRVE